MLQINHQCLVETALKFSFTLKELKLISQTKVLYTSNANTRIYKKIAFVFAFSQCEQAPTPLVNDDA